MQKWEYGRLVYGIDKEHGFDIEFLCFDINSGYIMPRFFKNVKINAPSFLEILNQLGQEGWEIIETEQHDSGEEWEVTNAKMWGSLPKPDRYTEEEWEEILKEPYGKIKGYEGNILFKRPIEV